MVRSSETTTTLLAHLSHLFDYLFIFFIFSFFNFFLIIDFCFTSPSLLPFVHLLAPKSIPFLFPHSVFVLCANI